MKKSKIIPVEYGPEDLEKIEAIRAWLRQRGIDQTTSAVIRYAVRYTYAAVIKESEDKRDAK